MPACDVPGCKKSSHFYDYYKDESKRYSFHRVPEAYRAQVCELLGIPPEKHNKSSIIICDSHMRPGAFVMKNSKKRLRTDFSFIELLVPPNLATTTMASPAPASAKTTITSPTSLVAAAKSPVAAAAQKDSTLNTTSYSEESSELSDEEEEMLCEEEPPSPPPQTKEPRSAHRQQLQPDPSPNQITSVRESRPQAAVVRSSTEQELMLRLKVSLTKAENTLMDNERRTRELEEKMSATSVRNQAELEARDKEIASLKKQVQQIIAENQSLVTANQSLSLDLTVYRKLVQFESNSTTKGGCLNSTDSPGKRFRGGIVRRSIEEDLDEEEEEPAKRPALEVAGHVMPASLKSKREPGTLDEIRKWLKNAKQF